MEGSRRKRVAVAYLAYQHLYPEKKRRYWTHPLVSARLLKGAFSTLFEDLKEDPLKFFNYFRMSIQSFNELADRLEDTLYSQDTVMRLAVRPIEMLAVTLRYLGSGCSMMELHYQYRLGHSTVAKIIRKVCSAVWRDLHEECLPRFTQEGWLENAEQFFERANFPNCIGALDGKHVRIVQPDFSGSQFFNYKKFFSVVLFVAADANYRFNYIEVGSSGREADSTIFEKSKLYNMLENGQAQIPNPHLLPGTTDITMPFVFVGDEAFSLSDFVMRPYTGKFLSYNKRIFNYRLCRARRYVECAFGILTNKWRIFRRAMDVNMDLAISIIKCCCVLHNYVRSRDGYNHEDTLEIHGLYNLDNSNATRQGGRTLNQRRNELAQYFVSRAGAVPWQDSCI